MNPLWLLVRSRARRGRNALQSLTAKERWVGVVLLLGSLAVSLVLFVGSRVALDAVRTTGGSALADAFAERIVVGLVGFLFLGSLPFVAGTLLSPGDLPLTATLPVSPKLLALSRLIEGIEAACGQFVVLGLPILAASLSFQPLSLLAMLLLPGLLVGCVVLPPLASSVALLLVARLVGVRRARLGVGLTSVLLAIVACLFAVSETASLSGVDDWRVALSRTAQTQPGGGHSLQTLTGRSGEGALVGGALLMTTMISALALAGASLGERTLAADGLFEAEAARGQSRFDWFRTVVRLVPANPGVRAILEKDLRYVSRDLTLLSQLGVPLILFLVPFVLSTQARRLGAGNLELLGLAALTIAFIAYMICSILGLSSVGLEGAGFGLIRAAPLTAAEFVRAKWWLAFLPSAGLSLILSAVSGAAFHAPPIVWALAPLALLTGSAALCGIEVGISGLFPRFAFENPAHRASLAALIWGFVGASVYALIALPLLVAVVYGTYQAPPEARSALIWGGSGAFLAFSGLSGLIPLRLATARLERYSES